MCLLQMSPPGCMGADATERVIAASRALFGGAGLDDIDAQTLLDAVAELFGGGKWLAPCGGRAVCCAWFYRGVALRRAAPWTQAA